MTNSTPQNDSQTPTTVVKLARARKATPQLTIDSLVRYVYELARPSDAQITGAAGTIFAKATEILAWLRGTAAPSITLEQKTAIMRLLGMERGQLNTKISFQWTIREPLVSNEAAAIDAYYPLVKLIEAKALVPLKLTYLAPQGPTLGTHEHYILAFHTGKPRQPGALLITVRPRIFLPSCLLPAMGLKAWKGYGMLTSLVARLVPTYDSRRVSRKDLKALRNAAPAALLDLARVPRPVVPASPQEVERIIREHSLPKHVAATIRAAIAHSAEPTASTDVLDQPKRRRHKS